MYWVASYHTVLFNEHIILCADCKAVVSLVRPEYDVEEIDRRCLRKAIWETAKNKKPDPCTLMKRLYLHTYFGVERILEENAQHFWYMMRLAHAAIDDEEDARALTTTRTVAELLDRLCIKRKWEETDLLEEIVNCLPNKARASAMSLLERYNSYLDVYDGIALVQDSLTKDMAALEADEAQIPVKVTVAKDLSEFTRKDCKEMLDLLLNNSYKIPRINAKAAAVKPGSTTVFFLIDKGFMENIIQYSLEVSTLWAFQELSVTRVRIGAFELNVVQLLTQHFKETLRSGLTSGMDFVRATKVCAC